VRPGVVIELPVEGQPRAFVVTESAEDEERVVVDLVTRTCVVCDLAEALEQLAQALVDRAEGRRAA